MSALDEQPENKQLDQTFLRLRPWVDERLIAKGLKPSLPSQRRGETPRVITTNVDQLVADIETLIRTESRRNFWLALAFNVVFFVLGLAGDHS